MLLIVFQALLVTGRPRGPRRDRGQTTAEYALVLLGAATVALVLVAWAAKSGTISALLDAVVNAILAKL